MMGKAHRREGVQDAQFSTLFLPLYLISLSEVDVLFGRPFAKVNEPRYIALFELSGYITTLFSTDCVNIYLFSTCFSIDFARWKSVGLPRIAYIVSD